MRRKITSRSKLIKKYLEHRKCKDYKLALNKRDRGRGIYVLYKGEKIYYIGLSKRSLRGEVEGTRYKR